MELEYVIIALLAGVLPALFWLWFWLREDRAHPEPTFLIVSAFISGMLVIPLVLPLQEYARERFSGDALFLVWVIIEEILKYCAALIVVLWNKAVDEPLDMIIYMIAIALGFAALENALFIFTPLSDGHVAESLIMGFFRFLGATLLHVLASGTVGVFMALVYHKRSSIKIFFATLGLFVAILLHALFNFPIMRNETQGEGNFILVVFAGVWLGIIVLFLLFEKIKIIEKKHQRHL